MVSVWNIYTQTVYRDTHTLALRDLKISAQRPPIAGGHKLYSDLNKCVRARARALE